MRLRTDDEVYRVDAVWLGPPNGTVPWRARYVAWFVGGLTMLLIMFGQRQVGIGFGFFSTGWALVAAIVLTRLICSRITYERPLTAVLAMWRQELLAPSRPPAARTGVVGCGEVRINGQRPRPAPARPRGDRLAITAGPTGQRRALTTGTPPNRP